MLRNLVFIMVICEKAQESCLNKKSSLSNTVKRSIVFAWKLEVLLQGFVLSHSFFNMLLYFLADRGKIPNTLSQYLSECF